MIQNKNFQIKKKRFMFLELKMLELTFWSCWQSSKSSTHCHQANVAFCNLYTNSYGHHWFI